MSLGNRQQPVTRSSPARPIQKDKHAEHKTHPKSRKRDRRISNPATQTAASPLLRRRPEESIEMNGALDKEAGVTLEELQKKMADFARERDWDQFHSPRNLLLALVGEVGELSEIFQWKGEVPRGLPGWEEEEKQHLGEELSDVLLYLVRLSDICSIDLGKAALRKLELNAKKYPVNHCKGSSKKLNLQTNSTATTTTTSPKNNISNDTDSGVAEC